MDKYIVTKEEIEKMYRGRAASRPQCGRLSRAQKAHLQKQRADMESGGYRRAGGGEESLGLIGVAGTSSDCCWHLSEVVLIDKPSPGRRRTYL